MTLDTWTGTLSDSFERLWAGIIEFLPNLVVAIAIFILGWVIGALLGKVVQRLFQTLRIDSALREAGVEDVVNKSGFRLDIGAFVGALVKWFIIAAFLVASLDVLELDRVNEFLQNVVLVFLPQVIVAVFILLVGALVASALRNIVAGSARGAGIQGANFLGAVAKWAIWIFAILAAFAQLGIATVFLQTLFTGVVIALSLAFGLAFGLGGQEEATRVVRRMREEIGTAEGRRQNLE